MIVRWAAGAVKSRQFFCCAVGGRGVGKQWSDAESAA